MGATVSDMPYVRQELGRFAYRGGSGEERVVTFERLTAPLKSPMFSIVHRVDGEIRGEQRLGLPGRRELRRALDLFEGQSTATAPDRDLDVRPASLPEGPTTRVPPVAPAQAERVRVIPRPRAAEVIHRPGVPTGRTRP